MQTTYDENFLEEIINSQVSAYNDQKIDKFIQHYSNNIRVELLSNGQRLITGKEEFKKYYENLFLKYPLQKATILKRMATNNIVIDLERLTGREDSSDLNFLIIYEFSEDKTISRVLISPQ